MTFFPEINIKKTKANAKRKLREYPRWKRVAGDVYCQKVTQTFSFEPRQAHGSPSRPVERLAINRADASSELEAIEWAVNGIIEPVDRKILFEKYLATFTKYDKEIYIELDISESLYYSIIDRALLSFAELYRNGSLLE